ncbi:MAG: response regulator [Methanospirillum sp.]
MPLPLYCDPDPAWRERAGRASSAEAGDLEVTAFGTLAEVFAALRANAPDAVVVDPPYEEGAPLLAIVRQQRGGIPFVLSMQVGREQAAIEPLNGGADRCVVKRDRVASAPNALGNTLRHVLAERTGAVARERRVDKLEFLSRTATAGSSTTSPVSTAPASSRARGSASRSCSGSSSGTADVSGPRARSMEVPRSRSRSEVRPSSPKRGVVARIGGGPGPPSNLSGRAGEHPRIKCERISPLPH